MCAVGEHRDLLVSVRTSWRIISYEVTTLKSDWKTSDYLFFEKHLYYQPTAETRE